uniref:Uncharacterized protein n=1 Tax=Cacopsylla melanoneura TaxID=428564 RepID=A0A8D8YUT3_9HEMI
MISCHDVMSKSDVLVSVNVTMLNDSNSLALSCFVVIGRNPSPKLLGQWVCVCVCVGHVKEKEADHQGCVEKPWKSKKTRGDIETISIQNFEIFINKTIWNIENMRSPRRAIQNRSDSITIGAWYPCW